MTVYDIPFPTNPVVPQLVQDVVLDGITYRFRFNYNNREDSWYMSLRTSEGDSIAEGIKIVLDFPLLRKVADSRRPPGEILAIENDTIGENIGQIPGLSDIGTRVSLIYIDGEQTREIYGLS